MMGFMEIDDPMTPADAFALAIDQFNRGEWFACHETLEELWVGERGWQRDLYQGILQVAVALHHWQEGNHAGAIFLLGQAVTLLDPVEPLCGSIDLGALIAAANRLRKELIELGPDHLAKLDRSLIPVICHNPIPPSPGA